MDAQSWDERYAANDLVWSSTPNQFVAAELADLGPGRALDVACGEGRNALWLADRGWHVTAVDFSLAGLDKGRALQAGHEHGKDMDIDWVHADVVEHDFAPSGFDGGFDLALVAYLQVPAADRHTVVRRTFGSLDVGGTFFLVAHDSTNLIEGTGGPQDAAVLYTAKDVLADLDGERFDVLRAERVARTVAGAEPDRLAYDALVRLVRTH